MISMENSFGSLGWTQSSEELVSHIPIIYTIPTLLRNSTLGQNSNENLAPIPSTEKLL